MEFSDLNQKKSDDVKHNVYQNTSFTVETIDAHKSVSNNPATREEELYDQLDLSLKEKEEIKEERKDKQQAGVLIYILLALIVLLYIAVIVLTVIIFLPKNAVNGDWSMWSSWGACSVTCDLGTQYRNRSCSNPRPNLAEDHCFGEATEHQICLPGACSDGGWSSWTSWGDCSESCDHGIRSQTRTCTNPTPSLLGKICEGNTVKVSICKRQLCPDRKVSFTAYGVSGSSTAVFSKVIHNYGNGYSNTTGIFTCTIPGTYYFSVQLSKEHEDDEKLKVDFVSCYLRLNSVSQLGVRQDPHVSTAFKNDYSGYSLSLSGTLHLNKDDNVSIAGCSGLSAVYTDNKASFTGFLISPDN